MKISAKTDYACRALMEMSLHWPSQEPIQLSSISKNQSIPEKFLTQIMLSLKQLGYVESIRGKSGGYVLAVEPKDISLIDIISNFDVTGCSIVGQRGSAAKSQFMNLIWKDVDDVIYKSLQNITFETIVQKKKNNDQVVMFEI